MGHLVTPEVFRSPAVGVLRELKRDGFDIELSAGVLLIRPKSRLTPERMQTIADCKGELKVLVAIATDEGVRERRDVFQRQLEVAPPPTVPAFLFRPGTAYVKGVCFSCGDTLTAPNFGRCWRCSMAWRLACRLPVPEALAAAVDTAKACA